MGSTFDKKMKKFLAGMIQSGSTCLGRPVRYFPRSVGTNTAHARLGSKNPYLHTTFPGRYRFSPIRVDLAAPGRCPDMMRWNTEDHELQLGTKLRAINPATKRFFWQVSSVDFAGHSVIKNRTRRRIRPASAQQIPTKNAPAAPADGLNVR